jgi:hypothetical protein
MASFPAEASKPVRADFSGVFSHLPLIFVAREVRAAGAGARRAAR